MMAIVVSHFLLCLYILQVVRFEQEIENDLSRPFYNIQSGHNIVAELFKYRLF